MKEVDITKQCKANLSINSQGEALIYLSYKDERIGLFDKHGFHFMLFGASEKYRIEDGYKAHDGIIWFKVYKC